MAAALALLAARAPGEPVWTWNLPPGFPPPRVPADNPMSAEKVELGRRLFFDTRLSRDFSMSCATCHRPELAFTDARPRAVGVTGETHPRGAMSLANVAYAVSLGWSDPDVTSLEVQLTTPLFGHEPVEMGLRPGEAVERLAADPEMARAFARVFRDDAFGDSFADPPLFEATKYVTNENLAKAIAAYERTLFSGGSAFDRYWHEGQSDALSPTERRGMRLFFSNRLGCGDCHRGFNLSGPIVFEGSRDHEPGFRDNGISRAKVPTLRNITRTAPYMHDGSLATLGAAIDHYAAGEGSDEIEPFAITAAERADLLAFLAALDDPTFPAPRDAAPRDLSP